MDFEDFEDELGLDDEELARVNVDLEFYLKDRVEVLRLHMSAPIKKGVFADVAELMDSVYRQIMKDIDSRSVYMLTFENEKNHHFSFMKDRVEAFYILAPDKLPEGFEKEEEDEIDE